MADETCTIDEILSALDQIDSWVGAVRTALSSIDPKTTLRLPAAYQPPRVPPRPNSIGCFRPPKRDDIVDQP
jgi:hypothetical protein